MIESYLLEELVTFARLGTLAETAKELQVTQPSITRGLQKLEDLLAVQLFERRPNKLFLTETGLEAVKKAEILLQAQENFIKDLRNYDKNLRKVSLASVAPGPLLNLKIPKQLQLQEELIQPEQVIPCLLDHRYSLIISHQAIQTDELESSYLVSEDLYINLDKMTISQPLQEISFAQLQHLSIVILENIGVWQAIVEREIPQAKFIYQKTSDHFSEIISHSNLPFFSSNLAKKPQANPENSNRKLEIPISDTTASLDFYLVYRKADRERLAPLIKQLQEQF